MTWDHSFVLPGPQLSYLESIIIECSEPPCVSGTLNTRSLAVQMPEIVCVCFCSPWYLLPPMPGTLAVWVQGPIQASSTRCHVLPRIVHRHRAPTSGFRDSVSLLSNPTHLISFNSSNSYQSIQSRLIQQGIHHVRPRLCVK